jgi:hypothetical protein
MTTRKDRVLALAGLLEAIQAAQRSLELLRNPLVTQHQEASTERLVRLSGRAT